MTENVERLAPQIWEAIEKSERVLLHFHPSPDGDSVGSALAVGLVMKGLGKEVTVISGDSEVPVWVSQMPGSDLVKKAAWGEIDASEFDLFLILDSSSPNQITKRGEVVFPEGIKTVAIDHHGTNTNFGQINLVDARYPAVAQMIFELLNIWKVEITPEIAACLMTGIYTDTGGFKYPLTSSETFEAGKILSGLYPKYSEILFAIENTLEPENLKFIGLALSSIQTFFSGNVAIAAVPYSQLQEHGIEKRHTTNMNISNYAISVPGWNIGISFCEVEPGVISISLRTRNSEKFDVGKIAMATGQGGGHAAAAGATLMGRNFEEALEFLLEKIKEVYPELGKA